jgi:outer membrane protein with beta-barrel domain
MKRIYLIGAALILFLALGINYSTNYFSKKPALNTQNDNATQVAKDGTAVVTPPADNTPVEDNVIIPEPSASHPVSVVSGNRKHYIKRGVAKAQTRGRSGSVENVKLAGYVQDDEVGAQRSNDYFANTPQKTAYTTKRVIRVRPAAHDDNKNCAICKIFNGRVGFGPEVGFNQNGVTNSPTNMLTGSVNAGLRFSFKMGDNFGFQPGLLYITKGTKYVNEMDMNMNEKLTTHYLELPADLVYKFGNPNNARLMIGAGPYISYLVGARDIYNSDNVGYTDVIGGGQAAYSPSTLAKVDWGLDGFVGCTTPEGIYAKVGAQLGLKDIQQTVAYGNGVRNYNFLFSVGYILGGNK